MNEMKKPINWLILLLLAVGTVLILRHDALGGSSAARGTFHTNRGYIFGTVYKTTYQYKADIQPLIEARLHDVDNSLSPFNDHSVITRINNGQDMQTDSLFRTVWRKADEVWRLTGGAFDITCAPLVNAWGFGFRTSAFPDSTIIDSLLAFVGMDKVRLDGTRVVRRDPRTLFDCSAIAKGFGSDCVAALFDSLGIRNYMIEIGGEVVVHGTNPKGNAWRIGINRPTDDSLSFSTELDTILTLTDCALATSGNYRNFYVRDGRRYAHTVDPRHGYPVQHAVLSATVIAPTCMEADALATSFMVIGADSARQIVDARPSLRAYLILAAPDDTTRYTTLRLGHWPDDYLSAFGAIKN